MLDRLRNVFIDTVNVEVVSKCQIINLLPDEDQ